MDEPVQPEDLNRLKWRCRRGLLENDLFISRFFKRHESALSVKQAQALSALMDLSDTDLLDLLLCRKTLTDMDPTLSTPAVAHVLDLLKTPPERPI